MSIASLQSLIQKYGANFGIQPHAAADSPSSSAPASASPNPPSTDEKKATAAKADSLDLSPAARDYLAAHTGPLGQFEIPNMMNYFFDAQSGSDGTSDGTGSSLLDMLGAAGSPTDASQSGTKPLASLTDFL
jgi:hypothetical protein